MEHICTLCNHWSRTDEQSERHEQTDAHQISALRARVAELEAENETLTDALQLIVSGDGVYGQQAFEYKSIARVALAKKAQS